MNASMSHPFVEDLPVCLRFYSRLNLPAAPGGAAMADFGKALRAFPVAGAIIGGAGGAALFCARAVGLPALPAAICAIGALVAVTGALHEDGLADVADGFGGGATREKKLEIMRDSRARLRWLHRPCPVADVARDVARRFDRARPRPRRIGADLRRGRLAHGRAFAAAAFRARAPRASGAAMPRPAGRRRASRSSSRARRRRRFYSRGFP